MIKIQNYPSLEHTPVKLIPLEKDNSNQLIDAASDGELWNTWYTSVPNTSSIDQYIQNALDDYKNGTSLPFSVLDTHKNKFIGTTRFYDIDIKNRRLLLGYTWYAKCYQRTSVNTKCKLLLLQYAFEELKVIAVEFRTHWFNKKSQQAIERLGAKKDGVLRNHMIMPDGSYRDTVCYSITESEWPAVKQNLVYKLAQYSA